MKKSMASIVTEASRVFDLYAASADSHKLQAKLAAWQSRNFGACTLEQQTLGVCEEAGELAHAVLKHAQKIRGFADEQAFRESAADAVADCTVFLMQVCTLLRLDYYTLFRLVAENVMERDFTKDAVNGGEGGDGGMHTPAGASDPTFPKVSDASAKPVPNEPKLIDLMEKAESILTAAGVPLPDGWVPCKETVEYSPPWNAGIRHLWIKVGNLLHSAYGDPHADGVIPAVTQVHRLFMESFGSKCPTCAAKEGGR